MSHHCSATFKYFISLYLRSCCLRSAFLCFPELSLSSLCLCVYVVLPSPLGSDSVCGRGQRLPVSAYFLLLLSSSLSPKPLPSSGILRILPFGPFLCLLIDMGFVVFKQGIPRLSSNLCFDSLVLPVCTIPPDLQGVLTSHCNRVKVSFSTL